MKLLTVTVPCYNSEAYMSKCVDSLLKGGERVEIVIIDDGSKDNTGKIADEYAAKYPEIVKVVHQENGGHGEGINQGIAHATGTYFKVVDSDDWVCDEFDKVLDELEKCEAEGGVDMFITNYIYRHEDAKLDRFFDFKKVLPEGKIFGWEDTKRFGIKQYFTIHNLTFRTQILRDCGLKCPKHCFYEDNYYIYAPLPYVKRMRYMNINLYQYFIGREGQSVARNTFAKRYAQQIKVVTMIFKEHNLDEIKKINKKLYKYMYHEQEMMFSGATCVSRINARLTKDKQPELDRKAMWKDCIAHNPKYGKKLRYWSYLVFLNLPGAFGRAIAIWLFDLASKVMQLN